MDTTEKQYISGKKLELSKTVLQYMRETPVSCKVHVQPRKNTFNRSFLDPATFTLLTHTLPFYLLKTVDYRYIDMYFKAAFVIIAIQCAVFSSHTETAGSKPDGCVRLWLRSFVLSHV
jgi:hypothetical protein